MPAGFVHVPGWLAPAEAAALFAALASGLAWEQPSVRMFGRAVAVPRLVCALGDVAYGYSGLVHEPTPWHPAIAALRSRLAHLAPFNTCLANRYRDGRDSVSWHADDEPELGPLPTIASISLGDSRTFAIRERRTGERTALELHAGDLVIMSGRSQLDYLHAIPKTARPRGERINLTFRAVVK